MTTWQEKTQTQAYPFQAKAIPKIDRRNGRVLLAWEPGLGKTFASLSFQQHAGDFPAVVVCPASVKYNWEKEAWMHYRVRAFVIEGTNPHRLGKFPLYICNYDIVYAWVDRLKELNPKLVIGDECQRVKEKANRCSKAFRNLCAGVPHVLALSGTPLLNRPIELFNALNILRPDVFRSYWTFGHRYGGAQLTHWGWKFTGATNTDELHALLKKTCMLRKRKKQVLKELPAKSRHVVPMPIDNAKEYAKAREDFIGWLEKQSLVKAKRAAKAKALVRMGYLKRLAAKGKLAAVFEWVESFLQSGKQKLVIFGIHREILDQVFARWQIEAVRIDGSTIGRDRQTAVDRFQLDPRCRLMVGNIQAAGVGITLTASSTVAFIEMGWTPGEHLQAEDRCHRIGTTEHVQIYYLVAKDTVESKLCELIQQKQDIISQTLDGASNGMQDLDVFNQLIAELQPVPILSNGARRSREIGVMK